VYDALEPLDNATRQKVLASVSALLGTPRSEVTQPSVQQPEQVRAVGASRSQNFDRPKSLVELMQEKQPKNNAQKIALFAYYRERVENKPRFAKSDLKTYFSTAKEKPAANYDRDFASAVKAGWIHEDGADSYLTSRGLEAVESSFAGKQPGQKKTTASKKTTSRKTKVAGRK